MKKTEGEITCSYCKNRAIRKIGNRWVCDDAGCIIKAVKESMLE